MPYADPKKGAKYRARWRRAKRQRLAARHRYHEKRDANICVMPYCGAKTQGSSARCGRCLLVNRVNKYLLDPTERVKARQALENFDGHCACCGELTPVEKWRLDHDHATGKFRGIVCLFCNSMLGFARDQVVKLQFGILYLEGFMASHRLEGFTPISSNHLDGVKYDAMDRVLHIRFQNGSVYAAHGVSPEDYQAFMDAPSQGQHYHSVIKSNYHVERVR